MTRTRSPRVDSRTIPAAALPQRRLRWWDRPMLLCSVLFTAVQVWALVVLLVSVQPDGAVRVALAAVMAAAITAVMSAWGRART
ncbi:hypothetical protein LZ318_38315 [Saccharopolyspora indica]|uniref:hypothetical protein n=1 Tax=Saccharopolyspora indica TaxID=1229659 RepID=UPI0022EB4BD6|nr:hypothetical protein [Saccharopolyspora indica]MDA3642785.1 hypothetical protein [Saccharopolyspora indica]